ncbi:hypothetical protein [Sphingomonas sp. PAMC 26617]|uniref:hypothetical protein n=1 Tax=Sphingomonas sp. PAMC 26617 TaxID=1112216 RepID=UPI000288DB0D|nr:hypothetical protein [Sphingomonas sp. PAMC 26617]
MIGTPLLEAVNLLETLHNNAARLGNDWLVKNRRQAVDLRRKITALHAEISRAGDETFRDTPQYSEFRSQFSKLRSAIALHQASWPIVAIDTENPEYLSSVQSTREASRQFITWVRQNFAGL